MMKWGAKQRDVERRAFELLERVSTSEKPQLIFSSLLLEKGTPDFLVVDTSKLEESTKLPELRTALQQVKDAGSLDKFKTNFSRVPYISCELKSTDQERFTTHASTATFFECFGHADVLVFVSNAPRYIGAVRWDSSVSSELERSLSQHSMQLSTLIEYSVETFCRSVDNATKNTQNIIPAPKARMKIEPALPAPVEEQEVQSKKRKRPFGWWRQHNEEKEKRILLSTPQEILDLSASISKDTKDY